mgnify:CR=1 FL=1
MDFISALVSFFLIWWVVLFMVLPWGNRPSDEPESGHAPSAPANPRLGRKFMITTLISSVLLGLLYVLVQNEVINYHEWARSMMQDDMKNDK